MKFIITLALALSATAAAAQSSLPIVVASTP
jgi:hypothetical protein